MAQIVIKTPYYLNPGESMELRWRILSDEHKDSRKQEPLAMQPEHNNSAMLTAEITLDNGEYDLWFTFVILKDGVVVRRESPIGHRCILLANSKERYEFTALWRVSSALNVLSLPPFSPVDKSREVVKPLLIDKKVVDTDKHVIVTLQYRPSPDESILLCGSSNELGHWDPTHTPVMIPYQNGLYLKLSGHKDAEYKFIRKTIGKDNQICYEWEEGANRYLSACNNDHTYYINDLELPHFSSPQEHKSHRIIGTVLPLFSLRTKYSMGCGDLRDAISFVDLLSSWGQHLFQLLPINDTTFSYSDRDSYPYNSITTYGIHPIYMDVRQLPFYNKAKQNKDWEKRAKVLNAMSEVYFKETFNLKMEIITACFELWFDGKGYKLPDFQSFLERDEESVVPYALFSAWRDDHRGMLVKDYPPYDKLYNEWQKRDKIYSDPFCKNVLLYIFIQQQLFAQLTALHDYASKKGVLLKGDLPIGVGGNSADAWHYPQLFNLDTSAGAPPDAFSPEGQQWGFPTYNWEEMKKDNYAWWTKRLGIMQRYFDAIRIDHILGFFRIWTIPLGNNAMHKQQENTLKNGYFVPAVGLDIDNIKAIGIDPESEFFIKDSEGKIHPRIMLYTIPAFEKLSEQTQRELRDLHDQYFYHSNEELWRSTAMERLEAIRNSTKMLLCAEDLGMLPSSVRELLDSFEIFSLEVVRMPKRGGIPLVLPNEVPLLSVLTTSTHDMSTLRGWWHSLTEVERDALARTYHFPLQAGADAIIPKLLETNAAMVILPLQDWCTITGYGNEVPPEKEQINKPEEPHHIWNYRMAGSIEELSKESTLIKKLLQFSKIYQTITTFG